MAVQGKGWETLFKDLKIFLIPSLTRHPLLKAGGERSICLATYVFTL